MNKYFEELEKDQYVWDKDQELEDEVETSDLEGLYEEAGTDFEDEIGTSDCEELCEEAVIEFAAQRERKLHELAERLDSFKNPYNKGAFEVILAMLRHFKYKFIVVNDELRVYDTNLGYFRAFTSTGSGSFRKFLESVAPSYWKTIYQTKVSEQVESYVKDNMDIFGYVPKEKHSDIEPTEYINFRNKTFSLRTGKLYKHSPKFQALSFVDADFIEGEWIMPELVKEFFEHLGNGEIGAKALFQIGGLAIAPARNLQVGAFLIGEGGSGKGVFTEILRSLLPTEAVITFALEELSQRFALKGLATAKLAICPELNIGQPQSADIRVLKSLISGDKVVVERKYKDPEEIRPNITILCCGNAFPQGILDSSGAMQRRIVLIKTGSTVKQRDPNLVKELMVYKNFIATAFALAASAVYNGESLISDVLPTVAASPRAMANQLAEDWLRKHVVADEAEFLNVSEAYQRFAESCEESSQIDPRTFGSLVSKLFYGAKERLPDGSYVRYGWRFVD